MNMTWLLKKTKKNIIEMFIRVGLFFLNIWLEEDNNEKQFTYTYVTRNSAKFIIFLYVFFFYYKSYKSTASTADLERLWLSMLHNLPAHPRKHLVSEQKSNALSYNNLLKHQ